MEPVGGTFIVLATVCPVKSKVQGGGVVGNRLQPQLLSNTLTGEWQNEEARKGQGSEPREPGGLRHQAGGVSWRALH